MMKFKHILLTGTFALLQTTAFATENVQIVGAIPSVVKQHFSNNNNLAPPLSTEKIILLQKIKLSDKAKMVLQKNATLALKHIKSTSLANNREDGNVQLGMKGLDVLDQGAHGSCVTFATGGIINTILNKNDYVSELCSLSLGRTLETKKMDYPSGWDGSWGTIVLKQMSRFGIVSKDSQHIVGCADVKHYPKYDPYNKGHAMTKKAYKAQAETIKNTVKWSSILRWQDADTDEYQPEKVLSEVKTVLKSGYRLTFGTLLDVARGHNGALGSYKKYNDTWMLTPAIAEDAKHGSIQAGHEMIITGFDDNAVVKASDGTLNKGVFTLRNSWGKYAGDNGDYYMSYDHFKVMLLEAQNVHPINDF